MPLLAGTLPRPIVAAPMAGGVTTVELAVAVARAGGFPFLAGGYRSTEQLAADIRALRAEIDTPFGVNLFVPSPNGDPDYLAVEAYRRLLRSEATQLGIELGQPFSTDDGWNTKLELLLAAPVAAVSFTFGCPTASVVNQLHSRGSAAIVTVTNVAEAQIAVQAGVDGLCVQGAEAGGHQGSFTDDQERTVPLLELLSMINGVTSLPLIAAGGIATAEDVERVLIRGGAVAAQVGTALLRCPESGANALYKRALVDEKFSRTVVTRAFTGRRARGLVNRFVRTYDMAVPAAYPQIHQLTAPLRAKGADLGDSDVMALWAGTGHRLATDWPATHVVAQLASLVSRPRRLGFSLD